VLPKFQIQFQQDPPAAQALALGLVTKTDLLRLKAIAKLHARGLPAWVTWIDLLQEAFARTLEGRRTLPPDVPVVAFIAEVMRSLRSDHLRQARREAMQARRLEGVTPSSGEQPDEQLAAQQELARIHALFADDRQALQVLEGLGAGLTPAEICIATGMSATDYDSTRKRIRRAMLREGLRYQPW
jgi:RNA polymerase sigma-70 factor (ECF subfamily)